jgi:hypothetical protein
MNLQVEERNPEIIELSMCFGDSLKAALFTLYQLSEPKSYGTPKVISIIDYLNVFESYHLVEKLHYTLNDHGTQMLFHIGEQIISAEKIDLQNLVDNLSNQEANMLFAISLSTDNIVESSTRQRLCDKNILHSDLKSITPLGLEVLLKYEELHMKKLRKLLN